MKLLAFVHAPMEPSPQSVSSPHEEAASPGTDLNQCLIDLARFGKPRLGMYGKGWHANVDMNTNTTGTSFEVKSDFEMPTPAAAVAQCCERVRAAMKALTTGT